ncbi:hypothetical protein [Streptomyces sp. enrichment culture]|uniref:hypothetical protein n=1 Tax=Streptomyces sp. enrichment culture TaxID=1795815 RepID=UPI003F560434
MQKISARAERRVERQLTAELKKVRGKEGILFRPADAAIGEPDEIVRTALYPVVGEKTLRDLVAGAKASEKVFRAKVRITPRSSYSSYYRRMSPPPRTLGFRCDNTAYRPVVDALALPEKYADVDGRTRFCDASDVVPMDGVVRKDWREAVVDDKGKAERIPCGLCVLVALRDAIRRREISIEGGPRWGVLGLLDVLRNAGFLTRLHRRGLLGRRLRAHRPSRPPTTPVARPVRAGHQHGDPRHRRDRRARRDRSRPAARAPALRHRRGPAAALHGC